MVNFLRFNSNLQVLDQYQNTLRKNIEVRFDCQQFAFRLKVKMCMCAQKEVDWFTLCMLDEIDTIKSVSDRYIGTIEQQSAMSGLMFAVRMYSNRTLRYLIQKELEFVTPSQKSITGFVENYRRAKLSLNGGSSALHYAVLLQNYEAATEIAKQLNSNQELDFCRFLKDDGDFSALELAICTRWNLLPNLLRTCPYFIQEISVDKNDFNCLSLAVEAGNIPFVEFFLQLANTKPSLVEKALKQYEKGCKNVMTNFQCIVVPQQDIQTCQQLLSLFKMGTYTQTCDWCTDVLNGKCENNIVIDVEQSRQQSLKLAEREWFISQMLVGKPIEGTFPIKEQGQLIYSNNFAIQIQNNEQPEEYYYEDEEEHENDE